jgi:hypothetical protein
MTVKWNFDQPVLRQAAMRGLVRGGTIVRNEMLRLILRTKKSGRVYTRRGVTHQASAPGEAPASDIGTLVQSISPPVPNASALSVRITVSAEHARPLEYGNSRMAARPFARPAAVNSKTEVRAAILHELRGAGFGFRGGTTRYSSKR